WTEGMTSKRGVRYVYPNANGIVFTSLIESNTEAPDIDSVNWGYRLGDTIRVNTFVGIGANASNWGIHTVTGTSTHRFSNKIPVRKGDLITGILHGSTTNRVAVLFDKGGKIVQTIAPTVAALAAITPTRVENDGYAIFYTSTANGSYVNISNNLNGNYGITNYDFNRV